MARYLDPKNDYAFRRIFGEHKELCLSLLNSLLPLEEDRRIVSIEYFLHSQRAQVPITPLCADSLLTVKCVDNTGQCFVVEIHIYWTPMYWDHKFTKRIIFDDAQMDRTKPDDPSLQLPVYMLVIMYSRFPYKDEENWIYSYKIADIDNPKRVLEGLNFVVVDLETKDLVSKIRSQQGWTMEKKRMAVLWMRFMKGAIYDNKSIDHELTDDKTISMALDACEDGSYTIGELRTYEDYWVHVWTELGFVDMREKVEKDLEKVETLRKAIEEKDKLIEDMKKQLEARSQI